MKTQLARVLVRIAGRIVPGYRRREWTEEWLSELAALAQFRGASRERLPGPLRFSLGAFAHAFWLRREGWTMDSVLHDVRYSLRLLGRAPGFTLVATLTLALGIGANASIFSLVNGLLFRAPDGIQEPERLIQIARSYDSEPRWDNFSVPAVRLIEAESRVLSGVGGYAPGGFVVGRGTETEPAVGEWVTGSYFDVLGVRPALGRLIRRSDVTEPGANPVVVLSHAFWTRRFGADPGVIGTTLALGSRPFEIVGVAPAGFSGPEALGSPPSIWVPLLEHPGFFGELPFDNWGVSWVYAFGRLREGVTYAEAEASMEVVTSRLREADPDNDDIRVLTALGVGLDPGERREAERVSTILFVIVGVVLLLACTNVANLFLARAGGRENEIGVRVALGAGRARLGRQLLTESLLLALFAVAIAAPLVKLAERFVPAVVPYTLSVSIGVDGRVMLFLLLVGLAAGLLFGLVPAWAISRGDVARRLTRGRTTTGSRTRLRDGLVVAQLGLSLGLVTGAALLGRSILNARQAEPGFDPSGLVAAFVDLDGSGRYDREEGRAFLDRFVREARRSPAVTDVTVANQTPIAGGHSSASARPVGREGDFEAEWVIVGPDYFEAMGIPILRGRGLDGLEEPERVVVVNQALADLFWPGEDPVGKELEGDPNWRVVGLAADVQMRSLRSDPRPAVYYPFSQSYRGYVLLHLRGADGHPPEIGTVKRMVGEVDPELPVVRVYDLEQALAASMGETRTIGLLVAAFAALALVLAAVGLYGVVAYAASRRVREMGIRLALGAQPDGLVRLVLRRGIALAVLGVAVGFLVSIGVGRALQGLLFGVTPSDALTFVGASVTLFATATLAAWLPARRASRVDAASSLRSE